MNQYIEKKLKKELENQINLKFQKEDEIGKIGESLEISESYSKAIKQRKRAITIVMLSTIEVLIYTVYFIVTLKFGIGTQDSFSGAVAAVLSAICTFVAISAGSLVPHYTQTINRLIQRGAKEFVNKEDELREKELELKKEKDNIQNEINKINIELDRITFSKESKQDAYYLANSKEEYEKMRDSDKLLENFLNQRIDYTDINLEVNPYEHNVHKSCGKKLMKRL